MGTSETICCRPPRDGWALAGATALLDLLAAMGVFTPPPPGKPPDPLANIFFTAAFAVCCFTTLAVAWWMVRAGIQASADGLRVRRFGGWKFIPWREVSDFYELLPPQVQSSTIARNSTPLIIEAASRKIRCYRSWSNADALRGLAVQNAVQSRADGWEVKGTRVVDPWPRTFDYNTRENRWAPRIWLKLFVVFVVYLFIQPALKLAATAQLIGWAQTLAVAGAYTLLVGSLGLIFLLPLTQYRAANRRKAERITAYLDGIMFDSGTCRVEAAWADVTGYQTAHGEGLGFRYVVETEQGEFDFLPNIGQARLLQAIIQRLATNAADHEWRSRVSPEVLGGEAARWTGGKVGVGMRFYHYRTRSYRAALVGVTFLSLVCLLLAISVGVGWLPGAPPPAAMAVAVSVGWGALLLLGLRAYLKNGIATDDSGLTQRTVFRSRYLAWEQVQDFAFSRTNGGKVVGRPQTLKFGSDIVGSKELVSEIRCRVERTKTGSLSSQTAA